jgi:hypothetical protein
MTSGYRSMLGTGRKDVQKNSRGENSLKDSIKQLMEDSYNEEGDLLNKWNEEINPLLNRFKRHKSQSLTGLNIKTLKELEKLMNDFSKQWKGVIFTRAYVNYLFKLEKETVPENYLFNRLEKNARQIIDEYGDIVYAF